MHKRSGIFYFASCLAALPLPVNAWRICATCPPRPSPTSSAGHVNVLLRQHGLTCAPAGRARRAGTRFTPGPEQRAVIQQFQASSELTSTLASAVGCAHDRLFDELSGRVPMPQERVLALARLACHIAPCQLLQTLFRQ